MPWSNGSYIRNNGVFSGDSVWADDAAAGTKIVASNHDVHDQDLANGINECLHKDGQNQPTTNMDWGGYRLTNLGAAQIGSDAVRKDQLITTLLGLSDTPSAFTGAANKFLQVNATGTAVEFDTVAYADITGTPSLAAVATSGDYSDLSGTPSLAAVATTGAYSSLTGRPSLATVATSGDYNDLINKPAAAGALGGLSDVDTTGVVDGKVLKYNATSGNWEPADDSGGTGGTTFAALTDTPVNYVGQAGRGIRVNAGATGLEFFDVTPVTPTALNDLSDVSGTPSNSQVLRYNSASGDWEPSNETQGQVTNISISRNATAVTVQSDTGSDGSIAAASATLAGVMTSTLYNKLNGIETGADVTDATNVAAAGAIMDSNFAANGVMVRTANGSYTSRTLAGAANSGITVTNGDGVSGAPTIDFNHPITVSASAPSGGEDGDVWFQYS